MPLDLSWWQSNKIIWANRAIGAIYVYLPKLRGAQLGWGAGASCCESFLKTFACRRCHKRGINKWNLNKFARNWKSEKWFVHRFSYDNMPNKQNQRQHTAICTYMTRYCQDFVLLARCLHRPWPTTTATTIAIANGLEVFMNTYKKQSWIEATSKRKYSINLIENIYFIWIQILR